MVGHTCDYLVHAKFCPALEGRRGVNTCRFGDTLHINALVIAVIVIDSFSQVAGLNFSVHLSSRCPVTIGYRNYGGGLIVHFAGMPMKKKT
jgi:hypothetical protein